ncbi:PTS sugar transporter subunit IIA [Litoreibacter roseus]|uniref:PTS lactose transporter subunit IIC n=1 Tax=Litoreibacter roseus TaxID=2601869 RepID=A0A6N6JGR1_9RHOB|nr:PTS sugar transporter subunit IIA [Litoreibacter roseus]GFE64579.1 PTS lactose transporter subunit IIC [Litoreibacter roseus]
MQISELLKPEAVKVVSSLSSKKRLFQEIAEIAEQAYGISQSRAFEALQDRENLGPTGVGKGVALPHARLEEIEDVIAVFIRAETPLDFDAADKQPVDLFFALLAPADSGISHLKALALVSRTMRDIETCAKLRANGVSSTLHTVLTEHPTSQAA